MCIRDRLGVADDLPAEVVGEQWYQPLMQRGEANGLNATLVSDARFDKVLTRAEAIPLFLMAACLDNIEVEQNQTAFPDVITSTDRADKFGQHTV